MDRQEHLLTCLAEEAGEVVQAVSKALRFGLQDGYPNTSRTNELDIKKEVYQLRAVFMMLQEEGILSLKDNEVDIINKTVADKVRSVDRYATYAREKGTLV